jgi:hypothetical protein
VYLSSLSCNIIIHFITSVFLPSPSSLLTLPHCLSHSFSILFLITFSVYFSPPSSSSSSLLPPPHYRKEYKEKDREDGGRMVKSLLDRKER